MKPGSWTVLPSHRAWLDDEGSRLLRFAAAAQHPVTGFAWLDVGGKTDLERPIQTWMTARMTHGLALANLRGWPGAGPLADHWLQTLSRPLRDVEHGGWDPTLS